MSIICSYDHDVSIVITDSSRRPRCRYRLGRVARKKTSLFSLPNMFYLPKMTILQPACSYAMFSDNVFGGLVVIEQPLIAGC